MDFNFSTNSTNIKSLFKKYTQFKIPVYQRAYTWEPYYYKMFLNDIIDSLPSKDTSAESNYFLGSLVFNGNTNDTIISVVDGQQRLTIITIILSAIAKNMKLNGNAKKAAATFRYVQDEDDNGNLINHLFSESNSPFLESFILSLNNKRAYKPATEEEELLQKTYEYFSKRLSSSEVNLSGEEYISWLSAVRDQILNSRVIEILTPNTVNAYKIFEILNAKGKELASIDLIKNIIFEAFYNNKENYESVAKTYWADIQSNLRQRKQSYGISSFYRQYWLSKYKKVPNNKLYDSFKETFNESKDNDLAEEYITFLNNLKIESETFIKIVAPSMEDYDNRQQYYPLVQKLKNLAKVLPNKQYTVALLALMDAKNRKVLTLSELTKATDFLENFIFMYTSMGSGQANIYENRFSHLAINLRNAMDKKAASKVLTDNLYNAFKDRIIDRDVFKKRFSTLSFSKKPNKDNLLSQYAIKKIGSLFNKQNYYPAGSSIEHIIPESDTSNITNELGNLIMLEKKINDECKDLPYANKIVFYKNSTNAQVDKFLSHYSNFKKTDIAERTNALAELYYDSILLPNFN